jgi:hypothetical protein
MSTDLSWIQFLLQNLPNELPLTPSEPIETNWWGDASTSFGVGVIVGHHWAVWRWAKGLEISLRKEYDIG